ncbi:TonB family protein [Altererythrobacter aerius]|uniref:TonB family protein n=1 Tax=Tsuneonella aeria TaxID=1837929 RepID=A0A6I4TFB4_9SPHN|nr:TonB family protein [Tsuneonella aeria]
MSAASPAARTWLPGAGVVTAVHGLAIAGVLWLGMGERPLPVEEPIVLMDLPPLAAAAVTPVASAPVQPQPAVAQPTATPRVTAPPVNAPLPREVVSVSPPAPTPSLMAPAPPSVSAPPVASAPASRPAPVQNAPARDAPGKSANDGDNPRAKQQEADYFAQLSAHLNKRKRYPTEAKKARQQGVVTVRFTVHADGSVTGSAIRRSSGHELLDQATLELLQRVAPLPRFPKSMTKPSITLSLPIDYSLQTS